LTLPKITAASAHSTAEDALSLKNHSVKFRGALKLKVFFCNLTIVTSMRDHGLSVETEVRVFVLLIN
jgi:hypothetical protein